MGVSFDSLKAAAHGRWREILPRLGIPAECLTNKHRSCPICGGRDRFRFDDKDGRGTFFCNQCGAGDGFKLAALHLNTDFSGAAQAVADAMGLSGHPTPARPCPLVRPVQGGHNGTADDEQAAKANRAKLTERLRHARPIGANGAVSGYLTGRGLQAVTGLHDLLETEADYWLQTADGRPVRIGTFPAMLAAIRDPSGELLGLHTTYLSHNGTGWQKLQAVHPETGEPLPARKIHAVRSGSIKGGGVMLKQPLEGHLIVGEGIESTLAAFELFGRPAGYGLCATLNAGNMARLVLPQGIGKLVIAGDHDAPRPVGQNAAHDLGARAIKQGIDTSLWLPDCKGHDPLDHLNHFKQPERGQP